MKTFFAFGSSQEKSRAELVGAEIDTGMQLPGYLNPIAAGGSMASSLWGEKISCILYYWGNTPKNVREHGRFLCPVFFWVVLIKTSPARVLRHFADSELPHRSANYAPSEMDLHFVYQNLIFLLKKCKLSNFYRRNYEPKKNIIQKSVLFISFLV